MGIRVILTAFLRALAQLTDRRFLGVALTGVALSLALFVATALGLVVLVDWALPGAISLPWIGEVGHLHQVLGIGAVIVAIVLSVFLMLPVAALFTGFFLDTVAAAVERRHYPTLPPVSPLPWGDAMISAVNFFGVLAAVNVLALILSFFLGPLAPLLFWALNGYLIGREYFELAATRRIGRHEARRLRRRHRGTIWLAGALMAAPLSLPFVNLLIPVIGAATFTHVFHALWDAGRFRA